MGRRSRSWANQPTKMEDSTQPRSTITRLYPSAERGLYLYISPCEHYCLYRYQVKGSTKGTAWNNSFRSSGHRVRALAVVLATYTIIAEVQNEVSTLCFFQHIQSSLEGDLEGDSHPLPRRPCSYLRSIGIGVQYQFEEDREELSR